MSYKFENLNVWQNSIEFVDKIYKVTEKFPQKEQFGLTNQVRRAAVSVALNIAEGCDKNSDLEFARYLRMSLGSINEVVTGLYLAKRFEYISESNFQILYEESLGITKQIKALIKSIKK